MIDEIILKLRHEYARGNPLGKEAADLIETLEEKASVLFVANVRLNSRACLDRDGYVDRIEKLEAALRDVIDNFFDSTRICEIARKALEGKDD